MVLPACQRTLLQEFFYQSEPENPSICPAKVLAARTANFCNSSFRRSATSLNTIVSLPAESGREIYQNSKS